MKLRTLAIAVAMASVSVAAQADVKISGDIGVGYFKSGSGLAEIKESGSEINIDGSEKVGSITYFGHLEMDIQGDDGAENVKFEELRVGAKGGFGEVRFGHLGDPGCGMVQTGGSYEVWLTHEKGGCSGAASNGISYSRSFGKLKGAITHTLKTSSAGAETSVGLSGNVGPITAAVGYTSRDVDHAAMSLSGKLGPVSLGFRYGKADGGDAAHGINAQFTTASGLSVYGGAETADAAGGDKGMSIGVKKVVGKNTDFIFEAVDSGASVDATSYGIGMRHRF